MSLASYNGTATRQIESVDEFDEPSSGAVTLVANRLPVRRGEDGEWAVSPGGLVSALVPVVRRGGSRWIGWSGNADEDPGSFEVGGLRLTGVPLSQREIDLYYGRFSNETLWPLFHDGVRAPTYCEEAWKAYVEVNDRFARLAAEATPRGGTVWMQDYHLLMAPALLRRRRPDVRIGLFLHIPVPPGELLATMPWREEILASLGASDLVGTQTEIDAEHLRRALERPGMVAGQSSRVRTEVRSFPISIDSAKFLEGARLADETGRTAEVREKLGIERTIFVGVDRLDYTKGIDRRLEAYERALEEGRIDAKRCRMVQVAVPSREEVSHYEENADRVDALVGRINGRFGGIAEAPVHYLKGSIPQDELIPLYRAADVMLVTPVRDGMNLVAKEYVATRYDGTGELVLSEFAGCAQEFRGATLVNPYDTGQLAAAIGSAYARRAAGRRSRAMAEMHDHVISHDVHRWAATFLEALSGAADRHAAAPA